MYHDNVNVKNKTMSVNAKKIISPWAMTGQKCVTPVKMFLTIGTEQNIFFGQAKNHCILPSLQCTHFKTLLINVYITI